MADEFDIIQRYFAPLAANAPGAFGLTDDAAVLRCRPNFEQVVTTDAIVAGVHYLDGEAYENVAAKLAGSNLSDLAAMGARPLGFTLACAWPKSANGAPDENAIRAFTGGLAEWVSAYDFPLLGGDTVSISGPAVFSLTAIGEVAAGKALRRNGARPGDSVFVTGSIGDGALGLLAAQGGLRNLGAAERGFLEDRYRRPRPRVLAGQALVGHAHACIDISDGLVQDLGHIARTSGVAIDINASAVPLSDAADAALHCDPALLERILSGGDDYELAFTAPTKPSGLGVDVHAIGQVVAGTPGVRVLDRDGHMLTLDQTGFRHFT